MMVATTTDQTKTKKSSERDKGYPNLLALQKSDGCG